MFREALGNQCCRLLPGVLEIDPGDYHIGLDLMPWAYDMPSNSVAIAMALLTVRVRLFTYADSTLRPLALRLLSTRRPFFVAILARKP